MLQKYFIKGIYFFIPLFYEKDNWNVFSGNYIVFVQ